MRSFAFVFHRAGPAPLLVLLLRATIALAQAEADDAPLENDAATPAPPSDTLTDMAAAPIVLPRLLSDPGVAYPRSALAAGVDERVEVVLIVVLDAAGNVQSASCAAPRGDGFDEEALRAARALRFAPALRAASPVAARIKYRYVFELPEAALSGQVVDAASGAAVSDAGVDLTFESAETRRTSTLEHEPVRRD